MLPSEWQAARLVAERQDWMLSADQAITCGLVPSEIANALRCGRVRSVYEGVYLLDPDLAADLDARQSHRAALLAHGDKACLVGRSAARAAAAEGLPASDPTVGVEGPTGPRGR